MIGRFPLVPDVINFVIHKLDIRAGALNGDSRRHECIPLCGCSRFEIGDLKAVDGNVANVARRTDVDQSIGISAGADRDAAAIDDGGRWAARAHQDEVAA